MAIEILKRVHSLAAARAAQGINIAWGFKGELEKLRSNLIIFQSLLKYAEERQITVDDTWRHWLDKVRDTAYQAEDVLDELGYEIIQRQLETQDSMKGKVCSFFSLSNTIAFGLRLTQELQKINERFDELGQIETAFGLRVLSAGTTPQPRFRPMTVSFSCISEVVKRRGDDVSKIINLLISSCSQQVLSVIPIVGMAGLGKTTVAKMVYREVGDRGLFDVTFWICVSDSFDVERILRGMLEQTLAENTGGITGMDAITTHLREELETKTFLLILDDVWNEDYKRWEILKDCLLKISGNNRNVVVVTTRSRRTASIMESQIACSHELKQLSNNECWSIIRKIVSVNGEWIPSELEAIGIDIAKRCGGMPLVARALGGMLFREKGKDKWSSIRDSDAFEMSRDYDQVLQILKFSFDHLPSTSLQRCFSYCSIFPKDFEIEKEKLIQLWLAEGLLGPSDGEMEDIGDRNFNDLLARSFFQDFQTDELGNVICCKMPNPVHDLALMVTKSETVIQEPDSAIDGTFITHLNLISSDERNEPVFLKNGARKLRTLFSGFLNKSWEFRSLRSLTLNDARMTELPDSICRLKHLRYLDVSRTDIKALPKSITKLYHLQTLRFSDCGLLIKLPNKMEYLVSLRHIDFSHTPADVGCLTGLRSLPFFEVGQDKGHKIEELGCLKELRGRLRIVNLDHVRDKEEAKGANLSGKKHINTLVLVWSSERESSSSSINYKDVLEGLQPHQDIRSLEIENYQGDEFPPWFLTSTLNNLVVLKLKGCKKLPPAGHPSHLKILEIEGMDVVEIIGEEFYSSGGMEVAFPCLEELKINGCPKLESIPSMSHLSSKLVRLTIRDCDALSHISGEFQASATSLKYLTIRRCSNLSSIPSLQSCIALEALSISACYNLESPIILESRSLTSVFIGWCGKASVRISWPLSYANMKELNIEICGELIFSDDLHGGEVWPSRFQSLVIRCCDQFKSVPDGLKRRLHSLVRLDISWCRNLSHIPEDFFRGLNQLKGLKIGGFSQELEAFPGMDSIQHLGGTLEELKIIGWKKLKSLPHQLQHLTSLTKLKIYGFNGEGFEEALPEWLANLSSLQELTIWECQNLKYLPSSTAMQRLSKLTRLIIRSSSLLKRNCTEGSGSEWPKISHIPHIDIP
ncbi:putative disease resistance protein RGA3 [Populus alba]|uniref:putative disease resistance protein RGA3 n=1 Tax=Populus alba TaxID=43335 RepID=UPI00158A853B|nr:putative disease resistance protein RGA1 [Populus alba]XP_034901402.1 putative disease resistance protein RGA1 [Populus alba]XP_034901403.1 putative disease resistance protein RGA1 [Populus alba]XP_034901404.1 putative disease resistance protein RGA1 [Populus alba]XP_034901405.1 putative disease resistance protein RGA1 [Populus alba]XP_034901406.1 putative disease resistance protein RGA1 [Populus alba]